MSKHNNNLLRLIISTRKLTAHVTQTHSSTIIAMASSTEQEFLPYFRAKLNRFPRAHNFYDAKVAARVGEKLGFRLKEIGVTGVEIDVCEEQSRPFYHRKMAWPLFDSVRRVGVDVYGVDRLGKIS